MNSPTKFVPALRTDIFPGGRVWARNGAEYLPGTVQCIILGEVIKVRFSFAVGDEGLAPFSLEQLFVKMD